MLPQEIEAVLTRLRDGYTVTRAEHDQLAQYLRHLAQSPENRMLEVVLEISASKAKTAARIDDLHGCVNQLSASQLALNHKLAALSEAEAAWARAEAERIQRESAQRERLGDRALAVAEKSATPIISALLGALSAWLGSHL